MMVAPIGRPRDADVDALLLRSAEEIILERGYHSLSIGAIASRAGTTRPSFYRRFDGIPHLMMALLLDRFGMDLDLGIDSGNVAEDLGQIQREQVALFSSPLAQHGLAGFLDALQSDADLRTVFLQEFLGPRRAAVAMIIRRAAARGEIDPDPDVEWACDLLTGPLLLRAVMPGLQELDETLISQTVSSTLSTLGYRTC
ncbi:TetR/AcrR family transcriptional regulator [Arthrobacter rhombi]|uniref:TetR/AcrR family transcriptional regulator n=1 Tax=Arthrobacter rhombi TaxID=71253 RepID=UPI003FD13C38